MNSITQKLTERIFNEYKKHPFLKFSEHNELLAMTLDAESMLCDEDGNPEDYEQRLQWMERTRLDSVAQR